MEPTIKDVASVAGVSIATVSHVINKTRYVSPALVRKVKDAIADTGYQEKIVLSDNRFRVGRLSEIAFIVPNISSPLYTSLAAELYAQFSEKGFLFSLCLSNGDPEVERHILSELFPNRRIAGIVLVPSSNRQNQYTQLMESGMPFVFVDQDFRAPQVECVLSDHENAMFMSTSHLLESGHEAIGLLLDQHALLVEQERLDGYRRAYREHGVPCRERNVLYLNHEHPAGKNPIEEHFGGELPTAFIAGGNRLTLLLIKSLENLGLETPRDVSVIGFGDDEWCEIVSPPLTTIRQDTRRLGRVAAEKLLAQLSREKPAPSTQRVPANFTIRKSTQTIGRGPFGEKAVSSEEIALCEEEIKILQSGDYAVCIAFHYCGTAWASLHEKGIRDTLNQYGVKIMSVTDAHFDPAMQVAQLEGMKMQRPDAIIAVPADDKITAPKFKELARDTNLIFISNVPEGLDKNDYCSCVSVNERENGQNAGVLLGEHLRDLEAPKLGFISHGTPFYGTHLRDSVACQVLTDRYPNVQVVANRPFFQIEQAYGVCKDMLLDHPEIQCLYISWDRPALEAVRAIRELGREDLSIITFDLDYEVAKLLAQGVLVRGLSTQRPYEQGQAVGYAVGKALLGQSGYKYVGVPPTVVTPQNMLKAWRDIFKEPAPEDIVQMVGRNFTQI